MNLYKQFMEIVYERDIFPLYVMCRVPGKDAYFMCCPYCHDDLHAKQFSSIYRTCEEWEARNGKTY